MEVAAAGQGGLTFTRPWAEGCRIYDPDTPEGAVGYTPAAFDRILRAGSMELDQPLHHGSWSGRLDVPDGQDIAVLRPSTTGGSAWHRLRGALRGGRG